jgi:shikimate dehydrogenase
MSTSIRLGLVGKDISYSLSPLIFEWGFRATEMEGRYAVYDLPEDALAPVVLHGEWDGLNVTIPYKAAAMRLCAQVSDLARDAGAVNTLYHKGGEICGENTDLAGFGYALARRRDKGESFRNALVIGSGGAARAVVLALNRGYHQMAITVASRDAAKARGRLSEFVVSSDIAFSNLMDASESLEEFDLIVNATPTGTASCSGSPLPLPFRVNPAALVMDLIYEPRKTVFLRQAEAAGARIENGLVMLIAQAAASFRLWTGREFPMNLALTELLPQLEPHDPLSHRG